MNQQSPANQNVWSSIYMDNVSVNIHNACNNDFEYPTDEMLNTMTNYQDLGNPSNSCSLEPLYRSTTQQIAEDWRKLLTGYSNLPNNMFKLEPLSSIVSNSSLKPLPSVSTGDCSSAVRNRVFKQQYPTAAEYFIPGPSSEGQQNMAFIGGWTVGDQTLQSASSVQANRKRRMDREPTVYQNPNMNMQQVNPFEVQSHPISKTSSSRLQSPPLPSHMTPPFRSQRLQRLCYPSEIGAQEIVHKINKEFPLISCRKKINKEDLRFLLQKELRNSDVNSLQRIVLPKRGAELHLPDLINRDGRPLPMVDMDTLKNWNFRYKFWPNNNSRMYVLENTGQFVKAHSLKRGDFILFYIDDTTRQYVIEGRKSSNNEEASGTSGEKKGIYSPSNVTKDGKEKWMTDKDDNEVIEGRMSSNNEVDSGTSGEKKGICSTSNIRDYGKKKSTFDKDDNEVITKLTFDHLVEPNVAQDQPIMILDDTFDMFPLEMEIDFKPGIPNFLQLNPIPSSAMLMKCP